MPNKKINPTGNKRCSFFILACCAIGLFKSLGYTLKALLSDNKVIVKYLYDGHSAAEITQVGWVEARNPTLTIRGIQNKLVFVTLPNLIELAGK